LKDVLYARLALIGVYRQLITPDMEPVDPSTVFKDLLSIVDVKIPSSFEGLEVISDQIRTELNCLSKLTEVAFQVFSLEEIVPIIFVFFFFMADQCFAFIKFVIGTC
jgi:hypothetical protein